MLTGLAQLLGWLARESWSPSAYAQVFALSWLVLLLWQPSARLRAIQAAALAGSLDLGLHVLAWAGMSVWLTTFSTVLTAADVAMSLSPLLVVPFLAQRTVRRSGRQSRRADQVVQLAVPEALAAAGAQAGSSHEIDQIWDMPTAPLMRIPGAAVPVVSTARTLGLPAIVPVYTARKRVHMLTARMAEWALAVYGLFLFASAILQRPYFAPDSYPGRLREPGLYQWYIGWPWFAISHHQSPLITPALGYPGTTNLMTQTSVVSLGILFGWLYPLVGATAVSNLIFLVNYVLLLVFGNLTLKRLGVNRLFSWIGTTLLVLIPYLSAQQLSHLNLSFIGFSCILGYLVVRLFTSQKPPSMFEGFATGASVLAIFYQSLELTLSTVLFALVVLLCACVFAPRLLWAHGKRILRPAFLIGVLPPLLLILPGLFNFLGSSGAQPILSNWYQQNFVIDLLSLILPTRIYLFHNTATNLIASYFTGGYAEMDGYISLPGLILVAVAAVRMWKSKLTRILVTSTVVMMILSLGPTLHVAGVVTHWAMPWQFLSHLPLLNAAIPSRFGLYFEYSAILLLTLAANTYAKKRHFPRVSLAHLFNIGSLLLVGILWLPAPIPSSQLPLSARILADPAVSSAYLDHKIVLFLNDLDNVTRLMGILADSDNYSFRSPNNYGTPAADAENPAMLTALKVVDSVPGVLGSQIEGTIPALHVQEVAFVSTDGQPIDSSLNGEVTADLGQPTYDNRGLVVFWTIPAAMKVDKLTSTADYLYQALIRYFKRQLPGTSNAPVTVQGLVNAGILPPTFLSSATAPDRHWTSIQSWIGSWSAGAEVVFSVNVTPPAAQAILKKYGRDIVDAQYPRGTHVNADAEGNRLLSGVRYTPAQQLFLVFKTSQLVQAATASTG